MINLHPTERQCNNTIGKEKEWKEYKCAMSEFSELDYLCNTPTPKSGCDELQSCNEIILKKSLVLDRSRNTNLSVLTLRFDDPRITYIEDFVSYDYHNFIGEAGGFMGLFLGFSFTSVFGFIERILTKLNLGRNYGKESKVNNQALNENASTKSCDSERSIRMTYVEENITINRQSFENQMVRN